MMKWFTSIAIVMGFAVDAGAASIAEFVSLHTGGAGRWTADYPGPDGYTIVCMRSVDQGREKRVIGWIPPNEKRLIIGLMLDENGNDLSGRFMPLCRSEGWRPGASMDPGVVPSVRKGATKNAAQDAAPPRRIEREDHADFIYDETKPAFPQILAQVTPDKEVGDEGSPVIVYTNEHCGHCKAFWKAVGDGMEGVKFLHVPVTTSASGMRAIADAGLGPAATVRNLKAFLLTAKEDGAVLTPTLFWRDPATGEEHLYRGNPGNRDAIRATLLGGGR